MSNNKSSFVVSTRVDSETMTEIEELRNHGKTPRDLLKLGIKSSRREIDNNPYALVPNSASNDPLLASIADEVEETHLVSSPAAERRGRVVRKITQAPALEKLDSYYNPLQPWYEPSYINPVTTYPSPYQQYPYQHAPPRQYSDMDMYFCWMVKFFTLKMLLDVYNRR